MENNTTSGASLEPDVARDRKNLKSRGASGERLVGWAGRGTAEEWKRDGGWPEKGGKRV